jgi:phenylpropionate dioxygenase-like ring-hydroxylating dioxygenase large terminal subunit
MIPNQWYAVLEPNEVPRDRPVGVVRLGEKLVFWRDSQGKVVCQRDQCAHRGVALSAGKVLGDCIQCPFHGLQYDATGRCRLIPANGKNTPVPEWFQVHTYPTHEAHGFIYIWWGEPRPDLPPMPFFADLDESSFTYGRAHDPWKTHYSRAIENQLDVVHLPFVHYNTIGRGGRTLVNGPLTKWVNEDLLFVYPFNQVDDGSPPLKPQELTEPPAGHFHLEFQFPNLWQNYISEQVRIVIAFVPVDEENTILYIHFYQKFMRLPILRQIVNWLSMPANLLIAHQDRRVVITQRPKRSGLKIGEKLFQGDNPIVAYRTRRQKLLEQAGAG